MKDCRLWFLTAFNGRSYPFPLHRSLRPPEGSVGGQEVECSKPIKGDRRWRITRFLIAVLSRLVSGPAPKRVVLVRLSICSTCEHRKRDPGGDWCHKCGCGTNPLARLDRKARMPGATCPLGLWPECRWFLTRLLDWLRGHRIH